LRPQRSSRVLRRRPRRNEATNGTSLRRIDDLIKVPLLWSPEHRRPLPRTVVVAPRGRYQIDPSRRNCFAVRGRRLAQARRAHPERRSSGVPTDRPMLAPGGSRSRRAPSPVRSAAGRSLTSEVGQREAVARPGSALMDAKLGTARMGLPAAPLALPASLELDAEQPDPEAAARFGIVGRETRATRAAGWAPLGR